MCKRGWEGGQGIDKQTTEVTVGRPGKGGPRGLATGLTAWPHVSGDWLSSEPLLGAFQVGPCAELEVLRAVCLWLSKNTKYRTKPQICSACLAPVYFGAKPAPFFRLFPQGIPLILFLQMLQQALVTGPEGVSKDLTVLLPSVPFHPHSPQRQNTRGLRRWLSGKEFTC